MNRMAFCLLWVGAAVCLAGDVTIERVDTYANVNKSSVVIHYTGAPKLQFFALDNSDGAFVLDLPGVFSHFDFSTLAFQQITKVQQLPLDPDESKGISVRFHLVEGTEYHVFDDGPGTLTLFFESTTAAPPVAQKQAPAVTPVADSLLNASTPRVISGDRGDHRFSRLAVDATQNQGIIYLTVDSLDDFSYFNLRAPDRFVLDLKGAIQSLPENEMKLDAQFLVSRIRFRQFQSHPSPITRVVLDLNGETHVNVARTDDGMVLVYAPHAEGVGALMAAVAEGRVQRVADAAATDVATEAAEPAETGMEPVTTEQVVADATPDLVTEEATTQDAEEAEVATPVVETTTPVPNNETSTEADVLPVVSTESVLDDDVPAVDEMPTPVADATEAIAAKRDAVSADPVASSDLTAASEARPLPQVDIPEVKPTPALAVIDKVAEQNEAMPAKTDAAAKTRPSAPEQDRETPVAADPTPEPAMTAEAVAEDVTPTPEVVTEAPAEARPEPTTDSELTPTETMDDVVPPLPKPTLSEDAAAVTRRTVKPTSQTGIDGELNGFQEDVKTQKSDDTLKVLFPDEVSDVEMFVKTSTEKQDSLEDLFEAAKAQVEEETGTKFEMASDLELQLAEMSTPAPRTFFEMMQGVSSTRRQIGRLVVTNSMISKNSALAETADMQEEDDDIPADEEGEDFESLFREGDDFESIGEKEYRGFEIAIIDVRDQPVLDLLRFIADQVGINLYVDPSVGDTKATYRFRNMPWDQVLDIILTNAGLEKEFKNGVLRVATIDKFKREAIAQKDLRIERELSVPTETVYRSLNYAKANDVMDLVQKYTSSRGSIMVDERTNTLIIQDIPKKLTDIRTLLNRLDVMIAQVSIEARIVETTTRFLRELGIQWGLGAAYSPETGTDTGLSFPNRIGLGGPTIGLPAGVNGPEGGYAVNFPVISENPSGVGLTLGNFLDNFKLEISLQLLESEGHGKIISSPKITTQNNKTAEISNGAQIPVQTVQRGVITTRFIEAVLSLSVTPQITSDETIIMDIILEKSEADFTQATGVGGNPIINTSTATTQVLVKNGGTAVIGGIFTLNEQVTGSGIPKLRKVPFLRRLFGADRKEYTNQELLIFVTPRIVKY